MSILRTLRALRARGGRPAHFVLVYQPPGEQSVRVGELSFDGTAWTFEYSDAYRERHELRPIEGFPDLARTYRSSVLFPFFAVRVPDVERSDVQRRLQEQHVDDPQPADLLRLFGRRVVSSPAFELLPA